MEVLVLSDLIKGYVPARGPLTRLIWVMMLKDPVAPYTQVDIPGFLFGKIITMHLCQQQKN